MAFKDRLIPGDLAGRENPDLCSSAGSSSIAEPSKKSKDKGSGCLAPVLQLGLEKGGGQTFQALRLESEGLQ